MLGLFASVLFLGVVGEGEPRKRRNIFFAFVAVMLFTVAFNTIM
jgi:hypothetical protein